MSNMKNHYGKWVDLEKPTTGVVSNNTIVQAISDEMYNGINLSYEEYLQENGEDSAEDYEDLPSDDWLIGDWLKDENGQYYPDPNGEYSAIVRECETQVVLSKYVRKVKAFCSPCFPGQADLDSGEGGYLAYDVPPEFYD